MAGYYTPGMQIETQKALSAKLDAATRSRLLQAALAKLPDCRSPALVACVHDQWQQAPGFDCQTLNDGWIGDFDKMEAAYAKLSCCVCPSKLALAAGAAAMVLAGIVIGRALR